MLHVSKFERQKPHGSFHSLVLYGGEAARAHPSFAVRLRGL